VSKKTLFVRIIIWTCW